MIDPVGSKAFGGPKRSSGEPEGVKETRNLGTSSIPPEEGVFDHAGLARRTGFWSELKDFFSPKRRSSTVDYTPEESALLEALYPGDPRVPSLRTSFPEGVRFSRSKRFSDKYGNEVIAGGIEVEGYRVVGNRITLHENAPDAHRFGVLSSGEQRRQIDAIKQVASNARPAPSPSALSTMLQSQGVILSGKASLDFEDVIIANRRHQPTAAAALEVKVKDPEATVYVPGPGNWPVAMKMPIDFAFHVRLNERGETVFADTSSIAYLKHKYSHMIPEFEEQAPSGNVVEIPRLEDLPKFIQVRALGTDPSKMPSIKVVDENGEEVDAISVQTEWVFGDEGSHHHHEGRNASACERREGEAACYIRLDRSSLCGSKRYRLVVDAPEAAPMVAFGGRQRSPGRTRYYKDVQVVSSPADAGEGYQLKGEYRGYTLEVRTANGAEPGEFTWEDCDAIVDVDGSFSQEGEEWQQSGVDAMYMMMKIVDYRIDELGQIPEPGAIKEAVVNVGNNLVNAYYDGTRLHFGDGDGELSDPLTDKEVSMHEDQHQDTDRDLGAKLIYEGQSGGLNEATSDIVALAFSAALTLDDPKRFGPGEGERRMDWWIGDKVWTPGKPGDGLRSAKDPSGDGKSFDDYPSYLAEEARRDELRQQDPNVEGVDVHHSSGIANHWFYLTAAGDAAKGAPGVAQALETLGLARDEAELHAARFTGSLWYWALTAYLKPDSDYPEAREATGIVAEDFARRWLAKEFGDKIGGLALEAMAGRFALAVDAAWDGVRVGHEGGPVA